MPHATQFQEVFSARLNALHRHRQTTRRRWEIWDQQMRRGHMPCFGTDARNTCHEVDCAWRQECMALKAEWQR